MALEQEGFKIINNITWQKTNPPPNLACRCFTHSTETILWAKKNDKKSRHFFNYQKMKEIVETDQWKKAKLISAPGVTPFKIDDLLHCEKFWLELDRITPEDVLRITEVNRNTFLGKLNFIFRKI